VKNRRGLVSTNPRENDGVLPGKEDVGDNNLARAGHEIGNNAKGHSRHKNYEHNTEKKKDRDMVFLPMGHGIRHNNPPSCDNSSSWIKEKLKP
jgi:hypothetical protein